MTNLKCPQQDIKQSAHRNLCSHEFLWPECRGPLAKKSGDWMRAIYDFGLIFILFGWFTHMVFFVTCSAKGNFFDIFHKGLLRLMLFLKYICIQLSDIMTLIDGMGIWSYTYYERSGAMSHRPFDWPYTDLKHMRLTASRQ